MASAHESRNVIRLNPKSPSGLLILSSFATAIAYFCGYESGATAVMSSLNMTQRAHPKPVCQKCNTCMGLDDITPCAEGFDMWSYSCLSCRGCFNMVETRTAYSASVSERRAALRYRVITLG